jgi:AcrR family transcriptional regulator
LQTAIDLIRQYGFENVTVSDIVKSASVSRGAFYAHFGNKEAILLEFLFNLDAKYLDFYQNVLLADSRAAGNPLLLFERFLVEVNAMLAQNGANLARHYYSCALQQPYTLTRSNRHYFAIVSDLIARCREAKCLHTDYSDEEIAEMALILNRGIVIGWALGGGAYPIDEKAPLIRKFLDSISAEQN